MLQRTFESFDKDKKGFISTELVGTILEMLGTTVNEKELQAIIEEVDDGNDGKLEFVEFALLASRFLGEEEEDFDRVQMEMKECFRLYDKTGNTLINQLNLWVSLIEVFDRKWIYYN